MVGDSLPSLNIFPHPIDSRVFGGIAPSMQGVILQCHNDKSVSGFPSHVFDI